MWDSHTTSTTYYSHQEPLDKLINSGVACPFMRYDEEEKSYKIGYCVTNIDRTVTKVFVLRERVSHIRVEDDIHLCIDLSRDGYIRMFTPSVECHLKWLLLKDGILEVAKLVKVEVI